MAGIRRIATTGERGQISGEDLLRACSRGEDAAWRLFLDRFGDLINVVILRSGVPRDEAEEVFQKAVLAMFESLGRLDEPGKLVRWIAGVARNESLDHLRVTRRELARRKVGAAARPREAPPLPDEETDFLERTQIVREAMASLKPRCRHLLSALYLSERPVSYLEIGRTLGIPEGSVGPTRARCLQALRAALREAGYRRGEPGWR